MEATRAPSLDLDDGRLVHVRHEARTEPLGVLEEAAQRKRLDARLAGLIGPVDQPALLTGIAEVRALPGRPHEHVGRHQATPRAHRLAEHAYAPLAEVGGHRQAIGPRSHDRDVEFGHESQCKSEVRVP